MADVKTNDLLMTRFEQMMREVCGMAHKHGATEWTEAKFGEEVLAGSTDMGNVSWVIPGEWKCSERSFIPLF